MMFRRRRHYPVDETFVRDVVRGPDLVTVAGVSATDAAYGRTLGGVASDVRFGSDGSASLRWSGECGPLQNFRGAVAVAANPSVVAGPNPGLPGTTPLTGQINGVLDLLAPNGQTR